MIGLGMAPGPKLGGAGWGGYEIESNILVRSARTLIKIFSTMYL